MKLSEGTSLVTLGEAPADIKMRTSEKSRRTSWRGVKNHKIVLLKQEFN